MTLPVPLDWYMAVDGLRVRNDTRWVVLVLNDDGSVTWEPNAHPKETFKAADV